MRKIVVAMFVSLDGVIQGPGAPEEDTSDGFELGGWVVNHFDQAVGATLEETFSAPYDLLLGRKTYDIFASYWPKVAENPVGVDEGDLAIATAFNRVTKYVATHSPDTLKWQNSKALGKDVVTSLQDLKRTAGPILLTQGSSQLVQTLVANDLVDEFRLLIFPMILGKGKRMFGSDGIPKAFKVTKSTTTPKGVLAVTYERAGEVVPGSFGKKS